MFGYLFLAPYARTTRYEEAFLSLENQGKKGSLRSRASLLILYHRVHTTEYAPVLAFRQLVLYQGYMK